MLKPEAVGGVDAFGGVGAFGGVDAIGAFGFCVTRNSLSTRRGLIYNLTTLIILSLGAYFSRKILILLGGQNSFSRGLYCMHVPVVLLP
jgi:hypothetical protein